MPSQGRRFSAERRVGPAEVGPDGVVHLDAIARWLQEIAFADALEAGLAEGRAWIVRRTLFQIGQLPAYGERVELQTACSASAAALAERRTSIQGPSGASIEAEAAWVAIDPESRMPSRLGPDFEAIYGPSAAGRRARARLRHPPPPSPEEPGGERLDWSFRAGDLDLAGHVNNAIYWQIAEQHLSAPRRAGTIEIEYRAGAAAGPASLLRGVDEGAEMLWVLGPSDELSASIRCD